MSRSDYSDELDQWDLIRWRGAVKSAIRGKRGQQFLREMLVALDTLPAPRLIKDELQNEAGDVCALGSLGLKRGIPLNEIDPFDYERVADAFGIAEALAREVEFMNDEGWYNETPEQRFQRIRSWVVENLTESGRAFA